MSTHPYPDNPVSAEVHPGTGHAETTRLSSVLDTHTWVVMAPAVLLASVQVTRTCAH